MEVKCEDVEPLDKVWYNGDTFLITAVISRDPPPIYSGQKTKPSGRLVINLTNGHVDTIPFCKYVKLI
jgi:hypothetical protein